MTDFIQKSERDLEMMRKTADDSRKKEHICRLRDMVWAAAFVKSMNGCTGQTQCVRFADTAVCLFDRALEDGLVE